jgi:hypothetical protein
MNIIAIYSLTVWTSSEDKIMHASKESSRHINRMRALINKYIVETIP